MKTSLQLVRAASALERADELVQDFLDVSLAEAGREIQLQKECCNVVDVSRGIVSEYQVIYPRRTRFVTAIESFPVILDKRALRRIVENLIGNALQIW